MTVPYRRPILPSDIKTVNSSQAYLRHPKRFAYRCFLPDLTEFAILCCIGPSFHRHLFQSDLKKIRPRIGFQPCCSGLQVQGTANSPSSTIIAFVCKIWRRGRDSNPRGSFWPPNRSPGDPVMTTSVPLRILFLLLMINRISFPVNCVVLYFAYIYNKSERQNIIVIHFL